MASENESFVDREKFIAEAEKHLHGDGDNGKGKETPTEN